MNCNTGGVPKHRIMQEQNQDMITGCRPQCTHSDLQFVIKCPQADIWRCPNVRKSAWYKNLIIRQNNRNHTNFVHVGHILTHFGNGSTFFCNLLHTVHVYRFFDIIPNCKVPMADDDAFFWLQMSAIFTKNVHKHCLHACSFLRVCTHCHPHTSNLMVILWN